MRHIARASAVFAIAALLLGGCGDDNSGSASPRTTAANTADINALFASYDVAVGRNPRVIVGLVGNDNRLVSFGTARFAFTYVGAEGSEAPSRPGPTAEATWIAIPGQDIDAPGDRAQLVNPSQGTGVYAAYDVTFDEPGFWEVEITVDIGGQTKTATAAFEVEPDRQVLGPGDRAPATANPLPGSAGVDPKAIDSRADDAGNVPDSSLHGMTIADALASGRPTMVVVSTPVYCQSRFCGPITDAVEELASEYSDRVNFVHLEVWEDFEARRINPFAAEWIVPADGEGGNEPWVFLVGSDGVITERWDNVASEQELLAALERVA